LRSANEKPRPERWRCVASAIADKKALLLLKQWLDSGLMLRCRDNETAQPGGVG